MVSEVLAQGFSDVVSTVANEYLQAKRDERAQRYTQENMRLAQQLNLESAYKSVAQSTAALEAAGINPALAVNGQTQAVGVSNPSGPASSAPLNKFDMASILMAKKELALLDAQKANVEADTDKKQAETEETKERTPTYKQSISESESRITLNDKQKERLESEVQKIGAETLNIGQDYKRKLDQDSKATELIRNRYNYLASKAATEAERSFWTGMAENANELSVGTFWALRDWSTYINDLDEYDRQMLARAMHKQLLNMQMSDDSVMYDLAHMPVKEFEKVIAEIEDLSASRDFRIAAKDVGIPAEAEYKQQISKTTRHNDFVGNIKDGNYSDAAWSQLPNLLTLVEHAAMLKYLKGFAPGSAPGSASVPYSSMSPKEIQRQLDLSNDRIKALRQVERSVAKNKALGQAYLEKRELENRLKNFR